MKHTDEQSYQNVYRTCFPKLAVYLQHRHACNQHDAEDIAAHALLILWEKWDSFETHPMAGMLRWLLLTAENLLRDENKKRSRKPTVVSLDELEPHQHPAAPFEPSPEQIEEEYQRCLEKLTARLPQNEATLLQDKIVLKRTDEEIAERLGISVNAVRVRWSRTKSRIRDIWDTPNEENP